MTRSQTVLAIAEYDMGRTIGAPDEATLGGKRWRLFPVLQSVLK